MSTFPSYDLNLTSDQLISDYETFRSATSDSFPYKGNTYTAVDKTSSDYAYINITSGEDQLTLIMNLEFYYVYGFVIDGQNYAYKGEAYAGLIKAGFDIPKSNIIPYEDAYYDIGSDAQIDAVCQQTVTLEALQNAIHTVADPTIDWNSKNEDLLRMFWCLVEGVRFSGISTIVNDLIAGTTYNTTFGYFYYMAERWAELSVGAAYSGKYDSSIAVYELHRLEPYTS